MRKYDKQAAIDLLIAKYEEIKAGGGKRYPKRSDFQTDEVIAIKAFLGPWPRALEAAGIKPPRDDKHAQRVREKRIRAKRNRIRYLKEHKNDKKE